ncbi:TonB-linked outer membrane protein, SusC/RagA family [Chitinophaga sp. CF118]|uniref:SusC/RagA family TonB-linked outer membrane protein n=1 Tax=Chitinophaga sp. CF118 TaxID=1884367 RepID=UPI0008E2434D|nr:SusC/RagA family TonB-linked outer membrane protein [Chitinophaga sp. CF118]SFF01144.1 TonB-linked outer membrane protein, SusC/RagA family [Chitinophaga sp. CF118]
MNRNGVIRIYYLFLTTFLISVAVRAQVPSVLNKPLTIDVSNQPISRLLQLIETQTGVSFAYANEILADRPNVTFIGYRTNLKGILDKLFPSALYQVKAIGKQIIIKPQTVIKEPVKDTLVPYKLVEMNTVVVTALGIGRQQRSLGYAYTDVKGNELTMAREINPVNALSGRVAGLDVNPVNSGVGGATKVTLRGVKIIGGNNQPLYVIDGIPINNSSPGQADKYGGYDLGDGTGIINQDEIETISVLKGGAAGALYGSRAGNGVILITTKKGIRKGFEATFSSNATIERINDSYDFQETYGSGRDGLLPANAAAARDFPQLSWGPKMNPDSLVWLWNGKRVPYVNAKNRVSRFFREGVTLTNSLAFSKGNEKTRLRFTYTNISNKDIIPGSGLNRHHLSIRATSQLTRRISMDAKITYMNERVNNRPALSDNSNNIGYVLSGIAPNIDINWLKDYKNPITGDYVNWNNNVYQVNPYWAIYEQPNVSVQNRLTDFVLLKYQLAPGLFLQARTGMDYSCFSFREFMNYSTPFNQSGALFLKDRNFREMNSDILINYGKQFSDFRIGVNAGANRMDYNETLLNTNGRNMNTRGVQSINNFQTKLSNEQIRRKRINSVYVAFNVSYKSYLYLDLTGRNDWSSTLAKGQNSFFYPSASASFVFSELMKENKVLSFGKIRFSIAQTGSDAIDPYQLKLTYGADPELPSVGGFLIGGVAATSVPFEKLKPSISKSYEVGMNLVFFENRISLDATWYRSNTRNQVLNAPVSTSSGYTSAVINSGNVLNHGLEVTLGIKPVVSRNFNWDVNINFARNKNKILALNALVSDYYTLSSARWGNATIVAKSGEEYGTIMGRTFLRDNLGRMILDTKMLPQYSERDSRLGNSQYKWIGGITNRFSYKNLALSVLVDIKQGGSIFSMTNLLAYATGQQKGTLEGREEWVRSEQERMASGTDETTWVPTGGLHLKGVQQNSAGGGLGRPLYKEVAVYVDPQVYWQRVAYNIPEASVYDASFVKVRQLNIDYSLPHYLFEKTVIKTVTFSLIARNPFILSKHIPNVDPESSYNNLNGQGFEYGALPTRRSYGINLNAKF